MDIKGRESVVDSAAARQINLLDRYPCSREANDFLRDPADDGHSFELFRPGNSIFFAVAKRLGRQVEVDDLKNLGFGFDSPDPVTCPVHQRPFHPRLWPIIDQNTGLAVPDKYRPQSKRFKGSYLVLFHPETNELMIVGLCPSKNCLERMMNLEPIGPAQFRSRTNQLTPYCRASAEAFVVHRRAERARQIQETAEVHDRFFELFGRKPKS